MKLNVPTAEKWQRSLSSLQRINQSIVENVFQNIGLRLKMSIKTQLMAVNKCGHDEEITDNPERAMYPPVFSIGLTAYTTKPTRKHAFSK
jgi:hypothetical protein